MKKRSRLLLVDDYAGVRYTVGGLLAQNGLEYVACASGEAALEEMQRDPAPLVITDHRMPGMTGVELMHSIKRRWKATRFILITGFESSAIMQEAVALGARIILKPFENYDFLMAVHGELAAYEWGNRKNGNGHGHA
jgi:CheY-like chemotaxis protein